jgi:hypothetical protein
MHGNYLVNTWRKNTEDLLYFRSNAADLIINKIYLQKIRFLGGINK